MKNTADVTCGKPIAVLLQLISGVSAINPLVAFYDTHGGKREVLFFYFVPETHETQNLVKFSVKSRFPMSVPTYAQVFKTSQQILMRFFIRQYIKTVETL
jgi:hypothetical protein